MVRRLASAVAPVTPLLRVAVTGAAALRTVAYAAAGPAVGPRAETGLPHVIVTATQAPETPVTAVMAQGPTINVSMAVLQETANVVVELAVVAVTALVFVDVFFASAVNTGDSYLKLNMAEGVGFEPTQPPWERRESGPQGTEKGTRAISWTPLHSVL